MGGGKKVCAWLLANCEVQLCSALAAISLLGVVVVCPVMLDPALETLASSFENAQCQTIFSEELIGLKNCSWTSCREGCTADVFQCWHIAVVYLKDVSHEIEGELEDHDDGHDGGGGQQDQNGTEKMRGMTGGTGAMTPTTATIATTTTTTKSKWNLSTVQDFIKMYNYKLTTENLTKDLSLMVDDLKRHLPNETGTRLTGNHNHDRLGWALLFPNQQKCVYPSETVCTEFFAMYGHVGAPSSFPCFVSVSNKTMVVMTVDKVGALRNIFYCFIPLVIASGVFTYLFYRVGLICGGRQRLKSDEESAEAKSAEGNRGGKNGMLPNGGAPLPGAPKKVRKKFLPKRKDSSKKRRQRKGIKKNAMSIKNQLSIKSASSSKRTPSFSLGPGNSEDGGYTYDPHRTSVPRL